MTMAVKVDPFTYTGPQNEAETISFANAHGYHWAYLDTCRANADALLAADRDPSLVYAKSVPDGWAFAWLEYTRRGRKMTIQEAFVIWRDTGSLPGLD